MLHFLLHRPVAVLVSTLGFVALGVVSLRMPEVSVQV